MTDESESPATGQESEVNVAVEAVEAKPVTVDYIDESGFELQELFTLAMKFYKDNNGKAFQPSYDDRNYFLALVLHSNHGPFIEAKAVPLGAFDLVGRDRRLAWSGLSALSKADAQRAFIRLLLKLCPSFMPYVEAHKRKKEKPTKEEAKSEVGGDPLLNDQFAQEKLEEDAMLKQTEELKRMQDQRRTIQEALNRQTYPQFKAYAEQQYPKNNEQQEVLISQLQDQHYQQYMQQMYQHQMDSQTRNLTPHTSVLNNLQAAGPEAPLLSSQNRVVQHYQSTCGPENGAPAAAVEKEDQISIDERQNGHAEESGPESDDDEGEDSESVEVAQMWTRKEMQKFKDSVKKEGGDGIIKVGHGEIVTIRVPTHPDGSCIFWEFATDSYDIGFGLLFEWTKNPGNQVSVHISESEDDEEEEEDEDIVGPKAIESGISNPSDAEKGLGKSLRNEPPCSVIIPIYRRECQEEVYAGSHQYPGKGVYLLKFDNSYSLWRSKTLYYRVYYTK